MVYLAHKSGRRASEQNLERVLKEVSTDSEDSRSYIWVFFSFRCPTAQILSFVVRGKKSTLNFRVLKFKCKLLVQYSWL